MVEQVVEQIIALKAVIICSAVATLLVTAVSLLFCRVFSFRGKNIKLMGFFYNMTTADTIALATCIMKLFVVLSMIFSGGRIQPVQIAAYGTLVVLFVICRHKIREIVPTLVNGAIIIGVLIVVNMLTSYLREVLFDMRIAVALVFLGIFLALFALYDIGTCVLHMIEAREQKG